ncbi:lysophospholipid acyltransferase family protein [bacterium]|nr:lysophospholipid acyltransferase family protein [bacterium]
MKHRLYCLLASTLGPLVVWLLCRFVRVQTQGAERLTQLRDAGRPVVYAFWHSRLLYLCYCPLLRGASVMVSRNRDGEYIARIMRWFGHEAVRGSSSRGGVPALAALARRVREGRPGALTVDGPRGPREVVQGGIIELASLSGAAILPMTFDCRPAWRLKSWDRFLLPRGYGQGILLIGAPIEVPSGCDKRRLEEKRVQLERALAALTLRAERYWDRPHAEVPAD